MRGPTAANVLDHAFGSVVEFAKRSSLLNMTVRALTGRRRFSVSQSPEMLAVAVQKIVKFPEISAIKGAMRHFALLCACAVAISAFVGADAFAQGRSGGSNGRGAGASQAPGLGGGPATGPSTLVDGISGELAAQSDGGTDLGFSQSGGYGQLGTAYSAPIGNSMFLQLHGGVDFEQQSSSDPAGALNGRIGLGWKY